jgi:formylglycine-generating enzyme required for sulfatase activity
MSFSGWLATFVVLVALSIGRALAGEPATAVATVTSGFVTAITVTSGGSGYTSEPWVTLTGGGGSGGTAKAILSGDKIGMIVILTAGSGYATIPTVTIQPPTKQLGIKLELIPKLTVEGKVGQSARVEWAAELAGPWTTWSNIVVGYEGTVLVDLASAPIGRFYRVVTNSPPGGPLGFVWIPPGAFTMGSPAGSPDRLSDETEHTVTITEGFWLSDHEVTQLEYESVMGTNPSYFKTFNRPVENVSWSDAVAYCQKLTEMDRAKGRIMPNLAYRLPTEAEWEYAARAGSTESRYGDFTSVAWWLGNSGGMTMPVRLKQPNAWRLFDMLGNVWEWCSDWYGEYPNGETTNPTGALLGDHRIFRGGCFDYGGGPRWGCSVVGRGKSRPEILSSAVGFRPALSSVR